MKFYVDYIDNTGDYCHVWVDADSKDDAISQAKREYWDIKTQNQYLYNLLLSGKSITGYEAMVYHHIGGLRARISDLLLDYGVPIDRRLEPNTDNKGYHARYFISEENRELLKGTPLSKIPNLSNHE